MPLTKHGFVCEKNFSCDFWVSKKLGCYNRGRRMREADDVTSGRVRFVLIAEDNPLWLHSICHWTEEPILDEP
jgi:hypothetical protein